MEKNTDDNELEAKWLKSLKIFGAYVIAAIGVVTSLDPIQGMINVSFNLVALAIYFFIVLTPPLISFYLFHQKEINPHYSSALEF